MLKKWLYRQWCLAMYPSRCHEIFHHPRPSYRELVTLNHRNYEYLGDNWYLEVAVLQIEITKCTDPESWYQSFVGTKWIYNDHYPHTDIHWLVKAPQGENEEGPADYLQILKQDCVLHTE